MRYADISEIALSRTMLALHELRFALFLGDYTVHGTMILLHMTHCVKNVFGAIPIVLSSERRTNLLVPLSLQEANLYLGEPDHEFHSHL